jgi:hypothetical protein
MPLFVDIAGGYVCTLERFRTWLESELDISILKKTHLSRIVGSDERELGSSSAPPHGH